MPKLIARGAEAKLFLEKDVVVKDRFTKTYRHPELDRKLRKHRTKREATILKKLAEAGIAAPGLLDVTNSKVTMDFVAGKLVKDILTSSNVDTLGEEIGQQIAKMHNAHLIHGDLTTSNMIFNKKVFLIDFGLSSISHKIEDKAVDIHVFLEAIESKHHSLFDETKRAFIKGYTYISEDAGLVLKRLEQVEARGRYKGKKEKQHSKKP